MSGQGRQIFGVEAGIGLAFGIYPPYGGDYLDAVMGCTTLL